MMFKKRAEKPKPRLMRATLLGADIDLARGLASWLGERMAAGTLGELCRSDDRLATDPVDELHLTIDAPPKQRDFAEACAVAVEMRWAKDLETNKLAHLSAPGHHALLHADLVVDIRTSPDRAERARDLAMDAAFLCPRALRVMHDPTRALVDELDEAVAAARAEAAAGSAA